jgi:hypothetical protein
VVEGEGVESEQVVLGAFEHRGDLGQRPLESFDRVAEQLARLLARVGVEDRPDQRGEHRLLLRARMAERLAEEVDGAALPGRAEHYRTLR